MKKISTLAASLLMGAMTMQAVPAWRGAIKAVQPDGTTITFYIHGDENSHECVTADGYRLLQDQQGAYRYAKLDKASRLVCDGSPIAHNPSERKAAELKYVSTLTLAKDLRIANSAAKVKKAVSSQAKIGMGTMSRFQVGNYPTKGEGRCLVLLVQFSDVKFSLDKDYHTRMLNEEGFADNGATGSARDYYIAQSGGQFKPTFDVVGPITLTRSERYYGQNDSWLGKDLNVGKMIAEACRAAKDEYGVDFSQYDGDGDGKVDMVYVIYAGYGEHAGGGENTIWPHKYQLSSTGDLLTLDGKTIDTYACSSELFGYKGTVSSGIGTVCHEFGHVLGLADHYDTGDATNYQLGRYDIMDYGSYNNDGNTPPSYNAFERMTLGWMTPTEINERAEGLTLENIAQSNKAYIVNTSNPDEFYLIENRQQTGWDSYIKSSGMMITHVDFNEKAWLNNSLNTDASHPRFCLVEADNEKGYDEYLGKETEKNDLYPILGNDSFTDNSTPAAKPYTGEQLNKWLTDIENTDGIVRFNFMSNRLYAPYNLQAEEISGNSFKAVWEADDEADRYAIQLNQLEYRSALQYADREGFALMTAGSTESADNTPIDTELDNYMNVKGYTGQNVYQAGGWCQIGTAGKGGSLTTPKFNLKRFDGEYAVAITVKSPEGKQPVLSVTSNGQIGKTRINSVERTYLFQFKGGISQTDITISTNSERALIDTLVICRGDGSLLFSDAKAVAVNGSPAQTEGDIEDNDFVAIDTKTIDNASGNSYTFDGLKPDTFYSFAVKAYNAVGESPLSEACILKTGNETGIKTPFADAPDCGNNQPTIYTTDGRQASNTNQRGLYIIKVGDKTRKVIVR